MTKHRKHNIAVIGCGAVVANYYLPALKELERLQRLRVCAFFDPHPGALTHARLSFPDAQAVTELFGLPSLNIDLAIVASPPPFHASQTITLLQSGIAVLCEKPMAIAVAEGEAMLHAATAAGRPLAIGLMRRFFPATQTIKHLLEREILGNIISFHGYEGAPFRWPIQSANFWKKSHSGGGVLLDIGVHALDLLSWWWGEPDEIIYEDDAMGGIEANCRLKLKFKPGFTAELRLSRDWLRPNTYVIRGTKGWVKWQVNEATSLTWGMTDQKRVFHGQIHDLADIQELRIRDLPAGNFEQSFIHQILNVMAVIDHHEPLEVSGELGLQSLKLIEYCYRHRRPMAMPWMKQTETAKPLSSNQEP